MTNIINVTKMPESIKKPLAIKRAAEKCIIVLAGKTEFLLFVRFPAFSFQKNHKADNSGSEKYSGCKNLSADAECLGHHQIKLRITAVKIMPQ